MWVGVVSLFPEMMRIISEQGVLARAIERGVLHVDLQNPRDFAEDRHATVDDRPYGGGPGMVMKVAPLLAAIEASKAQAPNASTGSARVVYLSPQGATLNQAGVQRLASEPALVLVAGRYEGIDDRLMDEVITGLETALEAFTPEIDRIPIREGFSYGVPSDGLLE